VFVAGDFNGWSLTETPLRWTGSYFESAPIELEVDEDVYYAFIVDDELRYDVNQRNREINPGDKKNVLESSLLKKRIGAEPLDPEAAQSWAKTRSNLIKELEVEAARKQQKIVESTTATAEEEDDKEVVGDPEDVERRDLMGLVMKGFVREAWAKYQAGQEHYPACFEICLHILWYAETCDLHKALCHFMLAHGEEHFLYHAREAVDLFENMFVVRPGSSWQEGMAAPSEKVQRRNNEYLELARAALRRAEIDTEIIEKDYQEQKRKFFAYHGRYATNTERVEAFIRANKDALDEMEEHCSKRELV